MTLKDSRKKAQDLRTKLTVSITHNDPNTVVEAVDKYLQHWSQYQKSAEFLLLNQDL